MRRSNLCPFVNKSDVRCATHWTLRNLWETFNHCADRFSACPVYRTLLREICTDAQDRRHADAARSLLAVG
jgi:hypothetical protein